MSISPIPLRLGAAEEALVAQLDAAGARDAALRFRLSGLPTRRVESYHYTDLKALLRDVPARAPAAEAVGAPAIRIPGAYRLLVVNGRVQTAGTAPAGVIAGSAHGSPLTIRDDVVVRLNAELVAECLRLDLEGSVDPVIHIDHRIDGPAGHVADGVKIFAGDNTSAVIVETFSGSDAAHLGNHGTYVAVGRNARLTHVQLDLSGPAVRHLATAEYLLAEDARLVSRVVHAGSVLARSQIFVRFAGEGAHGDFGGVNLVDDGQHLDLTLDIAHAVANTTSVETFKTVARGRSRGVFQGKIVVERGAQKTDAQMMSQGLMLSEEAEIFAKPELEIYADDVVCGHGATCGQLDEDHLFYLMSRGIPRADGEAMLVRAFLEEVNDAISDEHVHEALSGVIEDWLARREPKS